MSRYLCILGLVIGIFYIHGALEVERGPSEDFHFVNTAAASCGLRHAKPPRNQHGTGLQSLEARRCDEAVDSFP